LTRIWEKVPGRADEGLFAGMTINVRGHGRKRLALSLNPIEHTSAAIPWRLA
jgi:hypothetical protein